MKPAKYPKRENPGAIARKRLAAAFAADLCPTITALREEGLTLREIAVELNRRGIRTRLGYEWYGETVRALLKICRRVPKA